MSVARLTAKLTRAGMSQEEMEALDRKVLVEVWAKVVAEEGEKPVVVSE
jgi:microsomal dipeptidase-like Zn-dependent dipeptidase